jgi:arylsulfatase A-like enzyme
MNDPLSTQPRTTAAKILLTAVWVGLLIGFAEVSLRAIQVFVVHQWIGLSTDVVWMAPLADVSLLAIAGCVLLLAGRLWPRLSSCWTVLFVFTFLGLLGPILFIPRLNHYAGLLLACGFAVQITRMIVTRFDAFQLLVRKTTLPLVVIVFALSLSAKVWRLFEARSVTRNLAPAPTGAPNVLLIVLDTVRAKSLSLYGYDRRTTPRLEQLAKAGVVFERALSTSSWTLPAHATLFTGRYPNQLSADWLSPLDGTYPTLAEVLRSHGYVTAGFVANLLYCGFESGLARGFLHYDDYPISLAMVARSSLLARTIVEKVRTVIGIRHELVHKTAEQLNEEFLQWISRKREKPFFVFLNYFDAHHPYLPPKPFDKMFGSKRAWPEQSVQRQWSQQEIQGERDAYDGALVYLDYQIGLLLDDLQKLGLLGNTLIIITSDHGELLGEHGLFYHGDSLFFELLWVPLLISFPSQMPGERISAAVSLRDVPATILDLAGLQSEFRFPGHSLAAYWKKKPATNHRTSPVLSEVSKTIRRPAWLPASQGDMKSLVMNNIQYIKNGDGREELYDVANDPKALGMVGTEGASDVTDQFRLSLKGILAGHQD